MSVKTKTEEAPAAPEQPVDQTYIQPHRLTQEVREALAAPLDPAFLRSRKGDNGKMYTYADLDYLESRATKVDPDWENPAFTPIGQNGLSCTIIICGVPRSATAGYYIGDEYEVWDKNKGEHGGYVTRPMTSRVAHTTITAAQAAAERRAFAKHGLGAELWAHNEAAYEDDRQAPNQAGRQAQSSRNKRPPTEKRIKVLNDLGVPTEVAMQIDSTSQGNGDDGYPVSNVSKTIKALWAAQGGKDKGPLARNVWEPIVRKYQADVVLSGSALKEADDDYDEDFA